MIIEVEYSDCPFRCFASGTWWCNHYLLPKMVVCSRYSPEPPARCPLLEGPVTVRFKSGDYSCKWKHITSDDPDYWDYWETECGKTWQMTEGGLKKNGFKFCYDCGKEIEEVK